MGYLNATRDPSALHLACASCVTLMAFLTGTPRFDGIVDGANNEPRNSFDKLFRAPGNHRVRASAVQDYLQGYCFHFL